MKRYKILDYREGLRQEAPDFVVMQEKDRNIPPPPFTAPATGEMDDIGCPIVLINEKEVALMYYQYEEINE